MKNKLDKYEYYLAKVQKIAHIGFWELDLLSGKNWWSDEVYKIFGLQNTNDGPAVGTYLSMIHPDDQLRVRNARDEAIKNGTGYTIQIRVVRPDGTIRHVVNFAEVERNDSGESVRMFGVVQDITESVIADNIITEQNMRLAACSNFAAIGEMAGGIAHEINNPLAIIVINIAKVQRIASKENLDLLSMNAGLSSIEAASIRIAKIIGSLRNISDHKSDSDPVKLDLSNVLATAISLCHERITSGNVIFDLDEQSGILVMGKHAELVQVVMTLLFNAHDAVGELDSRWIKLEAYQIENSDINISVTDSGNGIPKSVAKKIMMPFFTTKPVGKGVGLGLSVARKIIESHGGTLSIDENCKNTKFVIRLPSYGAGVLVPISIDEAIDAHLKWKQKLLTYFTHPNGDLDPQHICRDDMCSLGKWIYHPSNHFSGSELFIRLKEKHKEFHNCTADLVGRVHAGEDLVGEVVLGADSEYASISNSVIGYLNELKAVISKKVS